MRRLQWLELDLHVLSTMGGWIEMLEKSGPTGRNHFDMPPSSERTAPATANLALLGTIPRELNEMLAYLRTEEQAEAFSDITPYKVVHSPIGNYAVFLCKLGDRRLRIHWFYEFEVPRIRLETGWSPYGQERIMGQPWAGPLFKGQDQLGGG